jgi:hypothetical protein
VIGPEGVVRTIVRYGTTTLIGLAISLHGLEPGEIRRDRIHGVVHLQVKRFELGTVVVECPYRWNSNKKAQTCGEQSFGNSARSPRKPHRRCTAATLTESVHDSYHRSDPRHSLVLDTDGGKPVPLLS